ncbi:MAG: alkaline phosphatase family protein [Marmoricola sp.]
MSRQLSARSRRTIGALIGALAAAAALFATLGASSSPATAAGAAALPKYDHVVLAIFENEAQSQIFGSANAPYLTGLANQGANFTQSYAIEHPSQPNYLDLFSGSNQSVTSDACPQSFSADNLGHQLISAGKTFVGYSENLPATGSTACSSSDGLYQRKHAPWVNFTDLNQSSVSKPYTAFPTDFSTLPTFSFVTPNMCDDMHDCSVSTGDTWAKNHLDAYAQWAKTHNSLLIVTFDEDDRNHGNQIETAFIGAHVKVGSYSEHIDHYTVLRTLEDMYGLPALGGAASRASIADVWDSAPAQFAGTYVITRTGTNTVITDPGNSLTSGVQMVATAATGATGQRWTVTANADGSYQFKNVASGLCLDNNENSMTTGTKIIQYPCHGTANQEWQIVSGTSGYGLVNVKSGLALGRSGGSDPYPLIQYSTSNSVWAFTSAS